jgi:hypothetical protein
MLHQLLLAVLVAPGRSDATPAITGSASGSSLETGDSQQQEEERGLKAATGRDVATAETAAATAVTAAPMAAPTKQNPGDNMASPAAAEAAAAGAAGGLQDAERVLCELACPRYDAFTDFWDMNRDMR